MTWGKTCRRLLTPTANAERGLCATPYATVERCRAMGSTLAERAAELQANTR